MCFPQILRSRRKTLFFPLGKLADRHKTCICCQSKRAWGTKDKHDTMTFVSNARRSNMAQHGILFVGQMYCSCVRCLPPYGLSPSRMKFTAARTFTNEIRTATELFTNDFQVARTMFANEIHISARFADLLRARPFADQFGLLWASRTWRSADSRSNGNHPELISTQLVSTELVSTSLVFTRFHCLIPTLPIFTDFYRFF